MSELPILVADIGATNARFAMAGPNLCDMSLEHILDLNCSHYHSFDNCLKDYLSRLPIEPASASISVAGLVMGQEVELTNLPWELKQADLQRDFGFQSLSITNDCEALAYSIPYLQEHDLLTIRNGTHHKLNPKVLICPGTGLGVAAIIHINNQWHAIPSEGGHVSYPAQSDREITAMLQMREKEKYVSSESFISGPGLVNLYNALSLADKRQSVATTPEEVTRSALIDGDVEAREALELFCLGVASRASDAALTFSATGGVYLGGGILPQIVEFLINSGFEERFCQKGRHRDLIDEIPVHLIQNPYATLIGAAALHKKLISES